MLMLIAFQACTPVEGTDPHIHAKMKRIYEASSEASSVTRINMEKNGDPSYHI